MTWWQILILVEVCHNFLGCIFMFLYLTEYNSYIEFERLNPRYIYKDFRVNWFGAFMIFLFANLLCPIGSICFWFHKLCTVGGSKMKIYKVEYKDS